MTVFFFTFYCLAHTQETLQTHYCPCDSYLWESLCFSVFNLYESFSSITFDIKLFLCQQKLLFWLVLLQLAYLRRRLMDTWKFAYCSKILLRCKVNSALAMLLPWVPEVFFLVGGDRIERRSREGESRSGEKKNLWHQRITTSLPCRHQFPLIDIHRQSLF